MTQQILECRGCGRTLPADAPHALCPACLLNAGLAHAADADDAASSHAADFTPPPVEKLAGQIPGLEVIELIGRGGMAAVYRARQINLDRPAALKILAPALAADPRFAERFEREAKAIARLTHQHLVSVYDFGRVGEFFYIVMEYIDGPNLRELMGSSSATDKDREGSVQRAIQITAQICAALQYAHDEGIVHRDIKPENILIDPRGRPKIADFGLAKLIGSERPPTVSLTYTSVTLGTPIYMAPEQLSSGGADVDHRADIYAAGVVLYEMLTRQLPLGHFAPPSKTPGVDARIDRIVERALARDAGDRYQRAGDLQTALEYIGRTLTIPDYAGLGIKVPRMRLWRALRLGFEVLVLIVGFVIVVPLYTGIHIGWATLMTPITFFNALEPLFGWFWTIYFAMALLLAAPLLLTRRWSLTRLPFVAGLVLTLAVMTSVVYRVAANPRVNRFHLPGSTGMVYYDQGNRLLVGMGNGQIYAHDPIGRSSAGQVDGRFSGAEYIRTNPDRSRLIVTRRDSVLELLDPTDNLSIAAIRSTIPGDVKGAFSPDGTRIAVVMPSIFDRTTRKWKRDGDSSLWIVSAADGSVLSREKTPVLSSTWQTVDWVGDLIAVSECYDDSGRGVMLYDIAQHKLRFNLVHPENTGLSVKLSPDGKTVAIGGAPWDVSLWDTTTGKLLHDLVSQNNWVVCLDFSPDGKLLASGEGNSAVRVWDVATGKQVRHFGMGPQNTSNYTNSVCFVPSGGLLAAGSADSNIVVWKVP